MVSSNLSLAKSTMIQIDKSRFPILVVDYKKGYTEQDVMEFMSILSALLSRGQPIALVNDHSHSDIPKALHRKAFVSGMELMGEKKLSLVRGIAVVSNSQLFRGVIMALCWMSHKSVHTNAFNTVDESVAWARQLLLTGK
jgi:hypothetical protein